MARTKLNSKTGEKLRAKRLKAQRKEWKKMRHVLSLLGHPIELVKLEEISLVSREEYQKLLSHTRTFTTTLRKKESAFALYEPVSFEALMYNRDIRQLAKEGEPLYDQLKGAALRDYANALSTDEEEKSESKLLYKVAAKQLSSYGIKTPARGLLMLNPEKETACYIVDETKKKKFSEWLILRHTTDKLMETTAHIKSIAQSTGLLIETALANVERVAKQSRLKRRRSSSSSEEEEEMISLGSEDTSYDEEDDEEEEEEEEEEEDDDDEIDESL